MSEPTLEDLARSVRSLADDSAQRFHVELLERLSPVHRLGGGAPPEPTVGYTPFDIAQVIAPGAVDDGAIATTVAAFLRSTGGGKGVVKALGNLGATETLDLALGNYQWGTLNANCVIDFTGWTNLKDCGVTLELIEDGAGGRTPTFTGVTWLGGVTPTHDTTHDTTTIYAFFSRDGGATIIGGVLGGRSPAALDDLTDVAIVSPLDKQRLRYDSASALWKNSSLVWEAHVSYDGTAVLDGAGNPVQTEVTY